MNTLGLGFILIFTGGILFFHLISRKWTDFPFRNIPSLTRLNQRIYISVEDGKRIHISLGRYPLLSQEGASALTGLRLVEKITKVSALSDNPPHITSGDASVSILSRDVIKAVYRDIDNEKHMDHFAAYMSGVTALSYVAGSLAEVNAPQTSVNLFLGNFGVEIGLLADSAVERKTLTVCGTSSLAGQAVLYTIADQQLLGEEVYVADAYLRPQNTLTTAAICTQDLFRWVLVLLILSGIFARFAGVI
jgi:hypothetical protein